MTCKKCDDWTVYTITTNVEDGERHGALDCGAFPHLYPFIDAFIIIYRNYVLQIMLWKAWFFQLINTGTCISGDREGDRVGKLASQGTSQRHCRCGF